MRGISGELTYVKLKQSLSLEVQFVVRLFFPLGRKNRDI